MPPAKLITPPYSSRITGIIVGIGIAAVLATYALIGIIDREVYLPGKHSTGMYVTGTLAVILSLAYLSGAAILHFHFFWGTHRTLCRYRSPLVLTSSFTLAACLTAFIVIFFKTT